MTLIVNGVDFVPYLVSEGYKVTREDGDGASAGRTMDYTMHRARIATKYALDLEFLPLYTADAQKVLQATLPEYVTITYTNPYLGGDRTSTFYISKGSAVIDLSFKDGKDRWLIDSIHAAER